MGEEKYKISDIYQGGYSSFSPNYGDTFTGYNASISSLGVSTDPRVADVLNEFSNKIAPGNKTVELSMITPAIFESVPKQHLKEIQRLAKLTGTDVTIHGPLIEPSGMTQQGYSELNRQSNERQMFQAIERSYEINPNGNIPVTFHSSAQLPGPEIQKTKEGEKIGGEYVVNSENGSIAGMVRIKERYFPGEEQMNIKTEIEKYNEESWSNQLTRLGYDTERATEFIGSSAPIALLAQKDKQFGNELTHEEKKAIRDYNIGVNYLNSSYREMKELFNIAYNNGNDQDKKILDNFKRNIFKKTEEIEKNKDASKSIEIRQEIIDEGLDVFKKINIPKLYKPLNEFAMDKTTTTFGNVAFQAYKQFGNNAPIISIENPPAGSGFARGEDLKNIVEESRKRFIENAKKDGISETEAKKAAEKLIGVTWDVGHINMLKKFGFEDKDLIKETEKVAPFVKHIHLSDNFGMDHTELPMGMGNVPFKEEMKALGKNAEQTKKIIEAGNWWQHFKTSPVYESFISMGSPIYGMKSPYFNQTIGLQQGYFGGYGAFLPQVNYETFGSGFFNLPSELGGQRQQSPGSRMSGRSME